LEWKKRELQIFNSLLHQQSFNFTSFRNLAFYKFQSAFRELPKTSLVLQVSEIVENLNKNTIIIPDVNKDEILSQDIRKQFEVFYQNQSKRTSRFHFFLSPSFLEGEDYLIFLAFLSFSLPKIKEKKDDQLFDLEFKTSDLLTLLNWKKTRGNMSKLSNFFLRWKENKIFFPNHSSFSLFHHFIFNKSKGIFKVAFNTDFLTSLFSQNLTLKQDFWKHWRKFNSTCNSNLPKLFIITLLAMMSTQGSYQSLQTLFTPSFFSLFFVLEKYLKIISS